jgi:hypothetical protein
MTEAERLIADIRRQLPMVAVGWPDLVKEIDKAIDAVEEHMKRQAEARFDVLDVERLAEALAVIGDAHGKAHASRFIEDAVNIAREYRAILAERLP